MKKVFFIGINGIGMSGLARIMKKKGYEVFGSDMFRKDITSELESEGIKIYIGHLDINVMGMDIVVYSSAIRKNNPEYLFAKLNNIPMMKRGELLANILNTGEGIAVAGTHGKTTTSSMLGVSFLEKSPTIVVGGIIPEINGNSKFGESDLVIAEADESDNSFLYMEPEYSIITNIEPDHLENHGNYENLKKSFESFIAKTKKEAIICMDCGELQQLSRKYKNTVTYSIKDSTADIYAYEIRRGADSNSFRVKLHQEDIGEFSLSVPGDHNISNSLGVIYLAVKYGVDLNNLRKSLISFKGAKRRFDILYDQHIKIIDDYAHHPTEIIATIKAAREKIKNRLIAIFQPHRYSRTNFLFDKFGGAFSGADKVILLPIYSAGESNTYGISEEMLLKKVKENCSAEYIKEKEVLIRKVIDEAVEGDTYIFMGAGDISKVANNIKDILKEF